MIKNIVPLNPNTRVFVVSDIHGQFNMVKRFMEHVNFDPSADIMISVGDLVDRGPNSLDALRLIREPWFFSVIGNHEDMMVYSLTSDDELEREGTSYIWYMNGGDWYKHLSVDDQADVLDLAQTLRREHTHVINVVLPNDQVFHVLHAELAYNRPLIDGDFLVEETMVEAFFKDDMITGPTGLWGRSVFRACLAKDIDQSLKDKIIRENNTYGHTDWMDSEQLSPIYVGHTIMKKPTKIKKLINLDTGSFLATQRPGMGVTFTEPATGKFWTVTADDIDDVELVTVC